MSKLLTAQEHAVIWQHVGASFKTDIDSAGNQKAKDKLAAQAEFAWKISAAYAKFAHDQTADQARENLHQINPAGLK